MYVYVLIYKLYPSLILYTSCIRLYNACAREQLNDTLPHVMNIS
jgi:hypothetical protein